MKYNKIFTYEFYKIKILMENIDIIINTLPFKGNAPLPCQYVTGSTYKLIPLLR